ncbi:MAG: hypothetical protein ACRDYA_00300 [Egibacteraceae bacterium]
MHFVAQREDGLVRSFESVQESGLWINGGYFMFRQAIFDYIAEGEDLIDQPFQRLIKNELLVTYRCGGFCMSMDTLRERQVLETLAESGRPPWAVWQHAESRLPVRGQLD